MTPKPLSPILASAQQGGPESSPIDLSSIHDMGEPCDLAHTVGGATKSTAQNLLGRERGPSGYRSFGVGEHPAGKVKHFYWGERLGEEAGTRLRVVRGIFADCTQNQNR